jgi:hypothetical protein
VKKELEGDSLHWIETSARHYVELSREYLAQQVGHIGETQDSA